MQHRLLSIPFALASLAALAGCGDDGALNPLSDTPSNERYTATIRRTSFGIPHVKANDLPSAAFALGYAGAQDYGCTLADQIVKVKSERAKTFGKGNKSGNIDSDFAYLGLGVYARAKENLATFPEDLRAAFDGFVAGYNHHLETVGAQGFPEPCKGAGWVKPITVEDLAAYYGDLTLRGSSIPFLSYVANAQPPNESTSGSAEGIELPDFRDQKMGSNGWAIGRDRSQGGRGMLVGNPHFPWEGELRFYESHITVPDVVDVYGASLLGIPVINIGFNEHVAWTHTVTPANHFTLYKLTLVPGDPTSYQYDGETRKMTSETFTIELLGDDGTLSKVERTFWRSHYGPVVNITGLGWTADTAFSFRDANETNRRIGEQWLRMNQSRSIDDLKKVHEDVHGIPWVFTIATDAEGNALVMDGSRVPKLSDEAIAAYLDALANDGLTGLIAGNGVVLLDGSNSMFEWVDSGDPDAPGLVPVAEAPRTQRTDFALNANDTLWLANPAAPVVDYSPLYGFPRAPISPRTRMNTIMLAETGPGSLSGDDGKFDLDELADAALANRNPLAETLLEEILARCDGAGMVDVEGTMVDVAPACAALGSFDGKMNKDSVGAPLFRELMGSFEMADLMDAGALFATPFDPDDPLETPKTLVGVPAMGSDPILVALGAAVLRLKEAGFEPDVTLGEAQFTLKGDEKIYLHGGGAFDGTSNVITYAKNNSTLLPGIDRGDDVNDKTNLTVDGYVVNYGTSYIMAMEFTDDGPRGRAFVTYSSSSDPSSPHFKDQTELFSDKEWRPILFKEDEILADENLAVTELDVVKKAPPAAGK